jgi:DNA-binding CsgD family transcriptional regulator
MTEEIWKPIEGYEDEYEVSSHGQVRSLDRCRLGKNKHLAKIRGKVMKQHLNKDGYYTIKCHKSGQIKKGFLVSRLVAQMFCTGYRPELQANHKDSNRTNNYYGNLEWVTLQENIEHCHINGSGTRIKKDVAAQARALKMQRKSDAEIARILGIGDTTVYHLTKHLSIDLQHTPKERIEAMQLRRWALGEPYAQIARHFKCNVKSPQKYCKDVQIGLGVI